MTGHPRGINGLLIALLLLGSAIAGPAGAQTATGQGDDPIGLGNLALRQGRLLDARAAFDRAVAANVQVPLAKRGLAEIAVRRGRLGDAENLYRESISLSTQSGARVEPDTRIGLGLVLIRRNRADEAAPEFQRALQDAPSSWDALYGQARLLLAKEQWEAAKGLLDRAATRVGLAEGEDKYHVGLALYNLGTGNLEEAERQALRALSLDPSDPERILLVSKICTQRRSTAVAITGIEQAIQGSGMVPTAPVMDELGRLYQQDQRYEKARDSYWRAVRADSTYAPALRNLGDLMRLAKQYDVAARAYVGYVKLEPKDVDAQLALAQACLEIGQYDRAAMAAREAMSLAQSRPDVRRTFVRAALKSSDRAMRATAVTAFTAMAADTTWKADDWLDVAEQQRESKQIEAARASLERARKMSPDLPQIPFQLGMIELSAGKPAEAAAQLERAVALKPDAAAYHLNLGIAYLGQKRAADGIAAMRRAVKANSKYTTGRLLLAQTLTAADSMSAAEAQYQQIISYEAKNAKALRGLGWLRLRRADYAEAVRLYRLSTEAEPRNADGWAGLGNAALGAGDLAGAEEALGKAKAIDPENATMKKGFELLAQARRASSQKG